MTTAALSAKDRLVFPLDYPTLDQARRGAELVSPSVGVLKVGLELFLREGPAAVRLCQDLGCRVFLDLKLLDIPATVARAVASACSLGVDYLTVHACGGARILEAAQQSAAHENTGLALLAVTVLTSSDHVDLRDAGITGSAETQVLRLAHLATRAGVRGLVCSAQELGALRQQLEDPVLLVCPGIRPAGSDTGDQKRTATPSQAIRDGADLLVVGRPIRDSADPQLSARAIVQEIAAAL